MLIRAFEARDQAAAKALILEGLKDHFGHIDPSLNPDLDDIERSYLLAGHGFWIAERAGGMLGTIGLLFNPGGTAQLVRLSVSKAERRRGVGRALFQFCMNEAREMGFGSMIVKTEPHWHAAMAFYRSFGFVRYDRDEIDIHLKLKL